MGLTAEDASDAPQSQDDDQAKTIGCRMRVLRMNNNNNYYYYVIMTINSRRSIHHFLIGIRRMLTYV